MRRLTISKKFNISMPPLFLNKLDTWAKMVNVSRSEFIRRSVDFYITHLESTIGAKSDS